MKTILAVIVVLFTSTLASPSDGIFARNATSIWAAAGETTVPSPDGEKAIVIRPPRNKDSEETHVVSVTVNGKQFPTSIGSWVNAEVLWSPDSSAFIVTYSDGGLIGTYHAKVFYVSRKGLRIVEPVPDGRKLFTPWCFEAERPNVAGVDWTAQDASRMLLVVQVPPHSSCADMATFRAYEIALPGGRVLKRYDQLSAKKQFSKSLSASLMDVEDSCVRRPGTCIPTGLKKP